MTSKTGLNISYLSGKAIATNKGTGKEVSLQSMFDSKKLPTAFSSKAEALSAARAVSEGSNPAAAVVNFEGDYFVLGLSSENKPFHLGTDELAFRLSGAAEGGKVIAVVDDGREIVRNSSNTPLSERLFAASDDIDFELQTKYPAVTGAIDALTSPVERLLGPVFTSLAEAIFGTPFIK